jgi:hypothetical protein
MKERIRELAEKANIEFTYDPTEKPVRAFAECWEDELEKFADMIVRECCHVMESLPSSTYHVGRSRMSEEIKQHFGVKE